jgi:D-alanine-D-alanine ligase
VGELLDRNLNIVVLMGGWSSERSVSLMSGEGVANALRERGFSNVSTVDMDRNVAQVLAGIRPDVIFNALHGTPGEDGTIQGLLDLMQIPYTHSGLETSVIAIDKELTKMVLVPHGIRMPKGICSEAGQRR